MGTRPCAGFLKVVFEIQGGSQTFTFILHSKKHKTNNNNINIKHSNTRSLTYVIPLTIAKYCNSH